MLHLIYELKKNCCGTDGRTGGEIEGSTRGPRGPKNGFKDINKTIVQPNDMGLLPFIARQCTPIKMSQMLPSQEAAILQNISNQASELALAVRGHIFVEKN